MPRFSSKHKGVEKTFSINGFAGGYTQERSAKSLSNNQLSECMNLRYSLSKDDQAQPSVILKKRAGTIKVSTSALPAAADIRACGHYAAQSQYIIATDAKLYYLDTSLDPVEIGSIDGVPTFTEFNGKLIIHDSGITKYWDGTNFGKVNRYYQDEIFTHVFPDTDTYEDLFVVRADHWKTEGIEPGTMVISFTATTSKTITDNGKGRLVGDVGSTYYYGSQGIENCSAHGTFIKITITGHGYETNNEVNIGGVQGTTEANNTASKPVWTVGVIDSDNFYLKDSTYANAYLGNGTADANHVNYITGYCLFTTSSAPDTDTSVTASYEHKDGAAKSRAGLVRASRLYTFGDSDNPSRITYSSVNDEEATDASSGGGYLEVNPDDGKSLLGALNFETTLLLMKEKSLHRVDGYPGETTFRVEDLTDDFGCIAHRTPFFEGSLVSFLSKEGWVAMHPSERFGDIQKGVSLSKDFHFNATRYANSGAYAAYYPKDKQLWISLSTNVLDNYMNDIFVVHLEIGGQLSLYKFKFEHSCFAYANDEMLVGGKDGNLYKMDKSELTFDDNDVDFSSTCYFRGAFVDWGLPNNWKHNKKVNVNMTQAVGTSATLYLYRNDNYTSFDSVSISSASSSGKIFDDQTTEIYDDQTTFIGATSLSNYEAKRKFNYKTLLFKLDAISGNDIEISGFDFKTAIIGDR